MFFLCVVRRVLFDCVIDLRVVLFVAGSLFVVACFGVVCVVFLTYALCYLGLLLLSVTKSFVVYSSLIGVRCVLFVVCCLLCVLSWC